MLESLGLRGLNRWLLTGLPVGLVGVISTGQALTIQGRTGISPRPAPLKHPLKIGGGLGHSPIVKIIMIRSINLHEL